LALHQMPARITISSEMAPIRIGLGAMLKLPPQGAGKPRALSPSPAVICTSVTAPIARSCRGVRKTPRLSEYQGDDTLRELQSAVWVADRCTDQQANGKTTESYSFEPVGRLKGFGCCADPTWEMHCALHGVKPIGGELG
jgi:hypothetical protein